MGVEDMKERMIGSAMPLLLLPAHVPSPAQVTGR